MKSYMFCFDVDGTLRDNKNHEISLSTQKALRRLKENGYKMIVSSGRGLDSLKRTEVIEMFEWDGFVLNAGQLVLDSHLNVLFEAKLSKETILKTIEVAKKHNMCLALKSHPRMITKEADEYLLEARAFFNSVVPPVGEYTNQEVDAMITYGPKGYDYAPFKEIEGIDVSPGESTYADLTIKGVNKATGIKVLLDFYHLDEYVAFGDSLNDVDMFKEAAISIAMGQGNQKLKDMATYVTSSIDDDGIYNACLFYKFI